MEKNETDIIDKVLYENTPRTRYQKRKLMLSPETEDSITRSSKLTPKRQHNTTSTKSNITKNDSLTSSNEKKKIKTKRLQHQRRQQFSHRVTRYKDKGEKKKKKNIATANKEKRDALLKERHDKRWLFTTMTQSSPNNDGNQDKKSFESISDIEGTYRTKTPSPSSSGSPSTSPHSSSEEEDQEKEAKPKVTLATRPPTPATSRIRPARFKIKTNDEEEQSEEEDVNKGDRDMKNLLSLWEAQKRAKEVAQEVEDDNDESDEDQK